MYIYVLFQGKEDLTPRVATLRDHNESISSQGTGMLRVAKTTPSRLKALFTSSKVANVATLPVPKKEEVRVALAISSLIGNIFRLKWFPSLLSYLTECKPCHSNFQTIEHLQAKVWWKQRKSKCICWICIIPLMFYSSCNVLSMLELTLFT